MDAFGNIAAVLLALSALATGCVKLYGYWVKIQIQKSENERENIRLAAELAKASVPVGKIEELFSMKAAELLRLKTGFSELDRLGKRGVASARSLPRNSEDLEEEKRTEKRRELRHLAKVSIEIDDKPHEAFVRDVSAFGMQVSTFAAVQADRRAKIRTLASNKRKYTGHVMWNRPPSSEESATYELTNVGIRFDKKLTDLHVFH